MIVGVSRQKQPEEATHATFSFGPGDRDRVEDLRTRLGRQGHLLNRSEIVRLGLLTLERQRDAEVESIVKQLPRLRPGRRQPRARR
jgi:hypothetical protein